MMRGILLAAAACCMATGCSAGAPATPVPDPPPALEKPARQPWGDTVAARVGALAAHIHDQLRNEHGGVRETHYIARDAATVEGLEPWYRARVGDGWRPRPVSLPPEEHGFAYVAGSRAFAVGWLDRLPDGRVPVVVMVYDGD